MSLVSEIFKIVRAAPAGKIPNTLLLSPQIYAILGQYLRPIRKFYGLEIRVSEKLDRPTIQVLAADLEVLGERVFFQSEYKKLQGVK